MTVAADVLKSALFDDKTAVSYQSLAYLANVSYDAAKATLLKFYEANKSELLALFSVSGIFSKNGLPMYSFRLATAENLETVKASMVSVTGVHIHTLAPKINEDSDPSALAGIFSQAVVSTCSLQMQQYQQVPLIANNAFRSNSFSSVKCSADRSENAYSAAVIASPPPAVVRDVFSAVRPEQSSAPKRTITDAFKKSASATSASPPAATAVKEDVMQLSPPATSPSATSSAVAKPKAPNKAMSMFMKTGVAAEKSDLFADREDPFAKPKSDVFSRSAGTKASTKKESTKDKVVTKEKEQVKEKEKKVKSAFDSMYDDDTASEMDEEEEEEEKSKGQKGGKKKSAGRAVSRRLIDEEEEEEAAAMAAAYARKEEIQKEVNAQVEEEEESAKQNSKLGKFLHQPLTTGQETAAPVSKDGRRKRIVKKEETFIDEEGFFVTRTVDVEEDVEDEELTPAPARAHTTKKSSTPKTTPTKKTTDAPVTTAAAAKATKAEAAKASKAEKAEAAKAAKAEKLEKEKAAAEEAESKKKASAGNILSFFKKK